MLITAAGAGKTSDIKARIESIRQEAEEATEEAIYNRLIDLGQLQNPK